MYIRCYLPLKTLVLVTFIHPLPQGRDCIPESESSMGVHLATNARNLAISTQNTPQNNMQLEAACFQWQTFSSPPGPTPRPKDSGGKPAPREVSHTQRGVGGQIPTWSVERAEGSRSFVRGLSELRT